MAVSHERLGQAISIARDFANQTIASLSACSLLMGTTLRERLPGLMWRQSLEDGLSIGLLMHMRYVGSARALLRPQFEAMIRGAWMRVVATDAALSGVENGTQDFPRIKSMTDALDKHAIGFILLNEREVLGEFLKPFVDAMSDHIVDAMNENIVDAMHDHTHRGTRALAQIAHANQDGAYGVSEDEPAVLWLATTIMSMAAVALLKDADKANIARDVHEAGMKASQSIVTLGFDRA